MEHLNLNMVAAACGAALGLVTAGYFLVRKIRNSERTYKEISYENLIAFADTCKASCPSIVKTRIVCERLNNSLYRISQLMLDGTGTAIKDGNMDFVGRIFRCRKIDNEVHTLAHGKFPASFDLTV